MQDYSAAYDGFELEQAYAIFSRAPSEGLNAAEECCDRWCGRNKVALYWAGEHGERDEWTFEQLRDASCRMANLFQSHGLGRGDRIAGLLPRTPDLLVAILAVWRIGAVYQPLFTAFGPKAIEHRLTTAKTRAVITDPTNRSKLTDIDSGATIFVTE